MVGGPWNSSP